MKLTIQSSIGRATGGLIIGRLFASLLLSITVGKAGLPFHQQTAQINNGSGTEGGSCQVTAGPNKGKSGTFTDGGAWCEGSWGGTECSDGKGASKCKTAFKGINNLAQQDVTVLKGFAAASQPGAGPDKLTAWQKQFNVRTVRKPNGVVVLTMPNRTLTIDGSSNRLAQQLK